MDMGDIELKLLAGMPIEIEGAGLFYSPTLREIISLGYSVYTKYISAILFDKSNIEGAESADISNFEFLFGLSIHNEDFRNTITDALSFFFRKETQLYADDTGAFFYLGDLSCRVNESNFETIQDVVKKANHIKITKEPEFRPANDKAREMIEKILAARKNRPKPKEKMNLHSIISGLAWRNNGINLVNIFDLTIYQVYDGFFRTEKIDNYQFTLSGIYAGTVNGKEINYQNIHWTRIIEEE
jgi:hypothetical protein